MSFKATLFIFGKEYPLVKLDYNFNQNTDYTGRPKSRVKGEKINVTFAVTENDSGIYGAMFSPTQTVQGYIRVYKRNGLQKEFDIKFANTYVAFANTKFNHINAENFLIEVAFSALIMEIRDVTYESPANPNNPFKREPVPVTYIEEEKEELVGTVDTCYYTDLNGQEIPKISNQKQIILKVFSKNMSRKVVNLDLSDSNHNFLYEGKALKNDILENYSINSDEDSIQLDVIFNPIENTM